jgi:cyclohexadieny/prephenate dehydrogenase
VLACADATLAEASAPASCSRPGKPGQCPLITDVASVKGALRDVADAARRAGAGGAFRARASDRRLRALRRRRGATPTLFREHRVILTPLASARTAEALAVVTALWEAAGAGGRQIIGVDEHDAVLAATSHLPHMLAFALVDALAQSELCASDIFRFAAGGFRDFTRIASSDPVMWRDVALANRRALLDSHRCLPDTSRLCAR